MKATLITQFKDISAAGEVVEMVIWRVPEPVPPTTHGFKYRLVYIVGGERVVGFDNERGKGDHRHWGDAEFTYEFKNIDQLIEDFLAEVDAWKNAH
ncbi:MAG: DUF6516 family protein [Thiolinea sp.]